jgi:hypothetical protein
MEQDFTGRIHKFIIIPVCTVYDKEGNVVDEDKMKPVTHYSANLLDLKTLSSDLEKMANERFFSKVKAPYTRRYNGDRGFS